MRVLIAGGGTGGHLYPGIAVAEEIYRQEHDSEVLFVGTAQGIESRVLPVEGYKLETIAAGGIANKNIISKVASIIKMIDGFIGSLFILRRFNPDVVLGVGGYAAAPVLAAAAILRFPIVIMEQNLFPGLANRVLSRIADKVVVAFEGSRKFFKRDVVVFGNPVRRGIIGCTNHQGEPFTRTLAGKLREAATCTNHHGKPFTIFIFGGSQGAHAINRAVVDSLMYLGEDSRHMSFIHQTGEADYPWVREAYEKAGLDAEILPYVYNMGEVYNKVDIVISRAGATTLAEITACGRPAILIPYPHAAHDHQKINAEYLESLGSAELILERSLTGAELANRIKFLFYNRVRLSEMSEKSAKLSKKNAAHDIVNLCRDLVN